MGLSVALSSSKLYAMLCSLIDLGDERLDQRLRKMLGDCLQSERSSLAALFGRHETAGKNNTKRAQAFLSNKGVDISNLRDCLYETTKELIRSRNPRTVLNIFDPTLLDFSKQSWKTGRTKIGDGNGLGYVWLNCLAVDPDSKRILGVTHQTLASEEGPDDRTLLDYAPGVKDGATRRKLENNHKQQFLTCAKASESHVPEDVELVHVADREFDDGMVLRALRSHERSHFVVRGNLSRVVQVSAGERWLPRNAWLPSGKTRTATPDRENLVNVRIETLIKHLPMASHRDIPLDGRGRICANGETAARVAKVSIGAIPVRIARKCERAKLAGIEEEPVWVNLVCVQEFSPPPGSKAPLLWLLLTDLPIGSYEEQVRVAEFYVCRWRTEEFFRTTKHAMGIEASELDDPTSTARLLFFVTARAIFLDELRADANLPAGTPPSTEQRKELERCAAEACEIEKSRQKGKPVPVLPKRKRAVMALGLIARLGGWASRNGSHLGNYILLRGLPVFLHDVSEGRYAWLLE